ncbi:MAG: RICIN domain-containing protein [Dehalococcoidales bacterium]|nr:RICIN domain-containing protein [Dehalococcoidales bacterium]
MATEGYGAVGGSSDITISLGSGGGSDGFFSLDGKYVSGGQHYLGLGESRHPVSGSGINLSGLSTSILFHAQSGNSMEIELLLVPLDNTTAADINTFKNPPPGTFSHLSPSSAAGERAGRMAYNAAERAVSAYRGWVSVSADGLTINLPGFNFNGIQVSNFVMTYEHISDDPDNGVPYSVIRYDYNYNPGGTAMETEALIFLGENPRSIPQTQQQRRILKETISPGAVQTGDSYSFASVWSGRHVTVTDTVNNAAVKAQPVNEGWTSQDWVAEAVPGQDRVIRIRNIWTGKYLHAQADEENAKAVCYDLRTDWTSQQWEYEQTGYRKVRLRNLWTNRYLTVVDAGDYADIILKELNTDWTSQEWNVDWLKYKY